MRRGQRRTSLDPQRLLPYRRQVAAKLRLGVDEIDSLVRLPDMLLTEDDDVRMLTERSELVVHMRPL